MSTLAERKAPPRSRQGLPCSVAELLELLPKTESAALRRMLGDRAWTDNAIYEAVVDEGHTVGRQSVGRHRRGVCRCGGRP